MMHIDLTADYHVHTRLCGHATGEMEEYVEAALARGLRRICFLEHLEMGIRYPRKNWLDDDEFSYYFREGARLKEKFAGTIDILLGIEAGYNPESVPAIRAALDRYPCDHVGLSYHYLDIGGSHFNVVSRKPDNLEPLAAHGLNRVLTRYFEGLLAAMTAIPCTVMCHLDAAGRHLATLRYDDWQPQIEAILQEAVRLDIALEVNTSGWRHRGEPYPSRPILDRALALGIPLIAGSDAHRPEDVGAGFAELEPWCMR